MTAAPGLAQDNVFMLGVTDLANGGVAILIHLADFARGQAQLRIAFIARHQRRRAAG